MLVLCMCLWASEDAQLLYRLVCIPQTKVWGNFLTTTKIKVNNLSIEFRISLGVPPSLSLEKVNDISR